MLSVKLLQVLGSLTAIFSSSEENQQRFCGQRWEAKSCRTALQTSIGIHMHTSIKTHTYRRVQCHSRTPPTWSQTSWCTSKTFCGFPGLKAIIGILWLPTSFIMGNTVVMHTAEHALPRQIGTATAAGKQYTLHFDSGHEVKCTALQKVYYIHSHPFIVSTGNAWIQNLYQPAFPNISHAWVLLVSLFLISLLWRNMHRLQLFGYAQVGNAILVTPPQPHS